MARGRAHVRRRRLRGPLRRHRPPHLRPPLESEIRHVALGADWRQIRIRYTGIASLSVADDGSLIADLGGGWGSLHDDAPIIYQEIGGKRIELPGDFVLVDKQTYSFEIIGAVDAAAPLVIDPELAWSTYLGGRGEDCGNGVAMDSSGNIVVTGESMSTGWVSGGLDTSLGGELDAFAVKLSSSGDHLLSTYVESGATSFRENHE